MLNVESKGPVTFLTLARPEVRNALNDELIVGLTRAFHDLPEGTRVVVLRGEGKAFCAGGDLEWMRRAAAYTEQQNIDDAIRLANLFESITSCPAVVVAQVHGATFGGGCGLVAACDVAIAAQGALFAFSEVRLGLVPATISPFVIAKVGAGHARALFTTGEPFDAARALLVGLVHEVVTPEVLETAVEQKIASILKNGPSAVAASKAICMAPPLRKQASAKLLARARAASFAVGP
jgi:enoyl-CoA hydratase/carnithine racemase